jgi:SLOG in TRPM, prokaryote/SMODS and SLOG-associating 2TM effector domain 1/Protein of unknown function (DUF4231)
VSVDLHAVPTGDRPVEDVVFGNGNQARLVRASAQDDGKPANLLKLLGRLGLQPGTPVLLLFGGAASLKEAERRVAERAIQGLVGAARTAGAVIIDGGTQAGVMELAGAVVAAQGRHSPLLGVAPAGCVAYPGDGMPPEGRVALDANHSQFVLSPGADWGDETDLLVHLAAVLAGGAPVVAVVAGGGRITATEAVMAVRRGWPLFVVEGSGGTADDVARRWRQRRGVRRRVPGWLRRRVDSGMQKIVGDGDLRLVGNDELAQLAGRLAWGLGTDPVAAQVWSRFARYDQAAKRQRATFERLQGAVLLVGVIATLVALSQNALGSLGGDSRPWLGGVRAVVIALPIVVSVLIATTNQVGAGKRWVLLRAAAESIKRELYRYRTRTGPYNQQPPAGRAEPVSSGQALADRVGEIEAVLVKTEASNGALPDYEGLMPPAGGIAAGDDGLSRLDPARYLTVRVDDQLGWFRSKVTKLEKRLRWFRVVALVAGGVGTLLAATGHAPWIGLTTAVATAIVAHLGYLQIEPTLVAYNQAASRLDDLRMQWSANPAFHTDAKRFEQLVNDAESMLELEQGGWVQQMSKAIEQFASKPPDQAPSDDEQGKQA